MELISIVIGPGSQPATVHISGAYVFGSNTFTAFGSRTGFVASFDITDDDVAMETVESYTIAFTSPSNNKRIQFGPPTTVHINDDD